LTSSDRSRFRAIYFSVPHSSRCFFYTSPTTVAPLHLLLSVRSASAQPFPQPLYHGALLNFFPPDANAQFILCLCTGDRVPSRSIAFSGGEVLNRFATGVQIYAVDTAFARNGLSTGGSDLCRGYVILVGVDSIIENLPQSLFGKTFVTD
jgi:hypothetical protein